MENFKKLLLSKITIIELAIFIIAYLIINKFFFFLLLFIFLLLIYKLNKTSNIPLTTDIKNITMKAFLENPNPSSDSFKDKYIFNSNVNIPHLRSDTDILIKIYSAALNEVDYIYSFSQFPLIRWFKMSHFGIGMDFSGKVIQVGEKVNKFKKGDEVFGFGNSGVLQEYTLTKENLICKKPYFISFNEAACLPCCFGTAYKSLTYNFNTDVKNKKVLIVGSSGGVGILAIQIAKYLQFEKVYGVCSSKNKSFVESFGIDGVLTYDKENYLSECKDKFDLIFDNASSPISLQYEKYKGLLKPNSGEYVVVNGTLKQKILGALQLLIGKKFKIEPNNFHFNFGSQDSKYLEIAVKMIEEKKLKLVFEPHNFEKKEIISCYNIIKSRRTRGKLIIEIYKDI